MFQHRHTSVLQMFAIPPLLTGRTFWLALLLLLGPVAQAQFEAYFDTLVAQGQRFQTADPPDYDKAIKKYQAASRADPSREKEANALILDVFSLIRQQRKDALQAKEDALKSEKRANMALGIAERERQEADSARAVARAAQLRDSLAQIETQQALDKANRLVSFFFDSVSTEPASWAYGSNGKFGVVDRGGYLKGGYVWEQPTPFQNSKALAYSNGERFFVSSDGQKLSSGYDWIHPTDRSFWATMSQEQGPMILDAEKLQEQEGLMAGFRRLQDPATNAKAIPVRQSGKYGFINAQGEEIIPQVWDGTGKAAYGVIAVRQDEKWGLIDQKGNELIPLQYEEMVPISDQQVLVREKGKYRLLSHNGDLLLDRAYDDYTVLSQDLLALKRYLPGEYDHIRLYFTRTGELDTLVYGKVVPQMANRIAVVSNEKWGLIDSTGRVLLPKVYDLIISTSSVSEPDFDIGKNLMLYEIDIDNDQMNARFANENLVISKPVTIRDLDYDRENPSPLIRVLVDFESNRVLWRREGKMGWSELRSMQEVAARFHELWFSPNGFAVASTEGRLYGLYNLKGEQLLPEKYLNITPDSLGAAAMSKDTTWGYFDLRGNTIIEPAYTDYSYQPGRFLNFQETQTRIDTLMPDSEASNSDSLRLDTVKQNSWHLFDREGTLWLSGADTSYQVISDSLIAEREASGTWKLWRLWQPGSEVAIDSGFQMIRPDTLGIVFVKKKDRWGWYNVRTQEIIKPKYAKTSLFDENRIMVGNTNGQQGLKALNERSIINVSYDSIRSLEHHFLLCLLGDNRIEVFDQKGEIFIGEFTEVRDFVNHRVWVRKDEKWALLDTLGAPITQFQYHETGDFVEGLAPVREKFKYRLVDPTGRELLPPVYDDIRAYKDGYAVAKKGERYGLLDEQGNATIPFAYDSITAPSDGMVWLQDTQYNHWATYNLETGKRGEFKYTAFKDFSNGHAWVNVPLPKGNMTIPHHAMVWPLAWGVIDKTEKEVIPFRYKEPGVLTANNRLWVLTSGPNWSKWLRFKLHDAKGNLIKAKRSLKAKPFSEGLAWVSRRYKWGLVDTAGKEILAPRYRERKYEVEPFKKGFAKVVPKDSLNQYGLLNAKGEEVLTAIYDTIAPFFDNRALVKVDSKYQYVFIFQDTLLNFFNDKYVAARSYEEGFALVRKEGEGWRFIDTSGAFVFQFLNQAYVGDYIRPEPMRRREAKKLPNGLTSFSTYFGLPVSENRYAYYDYKTRRWGFQDNERKPVIKHQYREVDMFSSGKAAVLTTDGDLHYIDTTGKVLLQPPYTYENEIYELSFDLDQNMRLQNGKARIYTKDKVGLMDASGKILLPPVYDEITPDSMGNFQLKQNNLYGWRSFEKKSQTFNEFGELPISRAQNIPCEYEAIANPIGLRWVPVQQNGKWGFLDMDEVGKEGRPKLIIPYRYDAVTPFFELNGQKVARVFIEKYDYAFFINEKGEMLMDLASKN